MAEPQRVRLTRVNGWTVVPRGAVRVDRATAWRSPFWIDQPYIFTRARLLVRCGHPFEPHAHGRQAALRLADGADER